VERATRPPHQEVVRVLLHPSHPRPLPVFSAEGESPAQLTVRVDLVAGRIALNGSLDRQTAHHLLDAATALTGGDHPEWVVDARELHFCDIAGLRAITTVYRRALRHGARLTVREPGAWLRRALAALRLDGHLLPEEAVAEQPVFPPAPR
jgi:anti-anti-sigma factor